ncbi:hypothetical protein [Paracoccus fontiphilus]|uniref:Uncharacterized protein n=1 Tax=Paracoccus fontiphilus TaxID=1815556 RepID=A0ABV7IHW7_9RHOB|nr:hypothetical protein [Paracoccus fontiphilus]
MTVVISARENFADKLTWWHDYDGNDVGAEHARLNLIQACKALWNDTGKIPDLLWHEVRVAIGNWKDADDWEAGGHKYSVAVRHIAPRLEKRAA